MSELPITNRMMDEIRRSMDAAGSGLSQEDAVREMVFGVTRAVAALEHRIETGETDLSAFDNHDGKD